MIAHAVVLYLVNALWRAPLVALVAQLLVFGCAARPATRARIWLIALAATALAPALPAARLGLPGPPAAPATAEPLAVHAPPAVGRDDPPLLVLDQRTETGVASAFAALTLAAFLRLSLRARLAGRLVRDAQPIVLDPRVTDPLARIAEARRLRLPEVRASDAVSSPAVVGVLRPVILTPPGFADWPKVEQRAALLHEWAHVARGDYAGNLLAEVLALPIAWHPAALFVKRRLRAMRELACDGWAQGAMQPGESYPRCLLAVAGQGGVGAPGAASLAIHVIGSSPLEERMTHLVTPGRAPAAPWRLMALGAGALVLAPIVLMRVTPARAQAVQVPAALTIGDAPAPAERPTMPPAPPAAPAARALPVAPAHAWRVARADIAPAMAATPVSAPDAPPAPPSPPAPPPPPPAPPMAPPPPPPPPAPPVPPAIDREALRAAIRQAVGQAQAANKTMQSAEVRKALAEARAAQAQWTEQYRDQLREQVREEVRKAMEQMRAHLQAQGLDAHGRPAGPPPPPPQP